MDTGPLPELPAELKQQMPRYKAPPGLERRIRHMLAQDSRRPHWTERVRTRITRWLPLAASFACGVLVAVAVSAWRGGAEPEGSVEQQVVAAHVRSLMADHLMDVAAADQHVVKPWFTGKLDFAPSVVDLAPLGFPLVGGRLDYLNDRAVAALVYRRRGHTINVFVMPASDAQPAARPAAPFHGYQLAEWQKGGMRFWAVSDLAAGEMKTFAQAMQAAE